MRLNDIASTSFRRHVPIRFLINQCQITTFLIIKSDDIENSRIDLKGIVLPEPSNQIKVTFIIILPFNLVHLWFFPVSHRNWRKMWVDYCVCVGGWGGGGWQRVCWPPLKLLGPPPLYLCLWRALSSREYEACRNSQTLFPSVKLVENLELSLSCKLLNGLIAVSHIQYYLHSVFIQL